MFGIRTVPLTVFLKGAFCAGFLLPDSLTYFLFRLPRLKIQFFQVLMRRYSAWCVFRSPRVFRCKEGVEDFN